MSGFPKWSKLVGGQYGQNDQKLHEYYKINMFEANQWEIQATFLVSGRDPLSPFPARGNPACGAVHGRAGFFEKIIFLHQKWGK